MELVLAEVLRVANALVWSVILLASLTREPAREVTNLERRIVAMLMLFGFWALAIGGTTPFGFPGGVARLIYTAFAGFSLIVGVSMLFEGRARRRDQRATLPAAERRR